MKYPPLYILRHGQTVWNAEHRVQGRFDSPLTEKGREHARMQRKILESLDLSNFDAFSSPQGRAFHTASIALEGVFDRIHTDAALCEISAGDWDGLARRDLPLGGPLDETEESALDLFERAPGGEGFAALRQRCESFLQRLKRPAVLVTHGVTSRMLRLVLTDRDTSEIAMQEGGQGVVFHVENGRQRKLSIGA